MNVLHDWARTWAVSAGALRDLEARLGAMPTAVKVPGTEGMSESRVQAEVRYDAARHGVTLWRNNVGVLVDERGVPVRYGLANDSTAVNQQVKSADLVGIRPVRITAAMVGQVIGQFVCREVKQPGWSWSGNERETAQMRWAQLVIALGGNAAFVTGPGSF